MSAIIFDVMQRARVTLMTESAVGPTGAHYGVTLRLQYIMLKSKYEIH